MDLVQIGKFIAELRKEQELTQEQLGEKIGICIIGVALAGVVCKQGWIISIAIFLLLVAHGWRNNTMMAYVEKNAYDGSGTR